MEIVIHIEPVAYEPLSAFLFDMGCSGIVSEDFDDRSLKAYLPIGRDEEIVSGQINAFLKQLEGIFPEVRSPRWTISEIENQDWGLKWRSFFQQDRITGRLLVVPAWESAAEPVPEHVIYIDPGPAFGTGQHPTTRMCLQAMENSCTPPIPDMLDVGTGSGILAIYGALLGIKRVLAVDVDPEALRWAGRNLELNGLEGAVELSSICIEELEGAHSLVAANLALEELIVLLPEFARLVKRGGRLILSGIMGEQIGEIKRALDGSVFELERTLSQEEWVCLICRKPF